LIYFLSEADVPLYVKDPETEEAVRSYAARQGLGVTAAIKDAVMQAEARLSEERQARIDRKLAAMKAIQERYASLPVIDPSVNADDWMYDENGLPH
jgi:hypothetical protein